VSLVYLVRIVANFVHRIRQVHKREAAEERAAQEQREKEQSVLVFQQAHTFEAMTMDTSLDPSDVH
jgi:hypothetical protein